MKKIIYYFLNKMFGKKKYQQFFLILKNISIQGLNYRNTDIFKNGEVYLIKQISTFYNKKNITHPVIFDVGANIGNYSKELNRYFKNNPTVYAFEPFSVPFKQLQKFAESNLAIKPINIGLSDQNQKLIVYSSDDNSEIGGVYDRSFMFDTIPHKVQEENQFTTLNDFCDVNKINQIHFIKIDVEGHELLVLKGASNFIENNLIDFIQFEFGAGNHFSKTFFMDFYKLLNNNYNLFRLVNDGLIEITHYNSDLEMQIVTNYVAINKQCSKEFLSI